MPTETVTYGWAVGTENNETGIHERVNYGWAMGGGPFQDPVEHVLYGWAWDNAIKELGFETVRYGWAVKTTPRVRDRVKETVHYGWGLTYFGSGRTPFAYEAENPIQNSTPSAVLPQTNASTGIYPRYARREMKEVTVNRSVDARESSNVDEDTELRYAWDVQINVRKSSIAAHWNFLNSHFGAGTAFYFYDLVNNGFQYDPTGVLTDGRYKVRFDTEVVPQIYLKGELFVMEYSLIEVA